MTGVSLVSGKVRGSLTLLSEGRGLRRGLGWVLERASGCGRSEVQGEATGRSSTDREGSMVSSLLLGLSSLRLLSDRTPPYRRSPLHIVYDFGLAMLTMWFACGPNRERNTGNKEGRIR